MGEKIVKPDLPVPHSVLKNISIHVVPSAGGELKPGNSSPAEFSLSSGQELPVASSPGRLHMQVKLFGFIPVRDMVVNVLPRVKVVPGGQSIGVLLHSHGVMVVGLADVNTPSRGKVNPAAEAGIKVGDIILKINGISVSSDTQVRDIINQAGCNAKAITVKIKRGKKIFNTDIKPAYCRETRRYRVGLFIRDSAAGVGTLTFYHPPSKCYGALGHIITDIDTSKQIDLADGCIVGAKIHGVYPGRKGRPGEKIGYFENDSFLTGSINRNTKYGIFGKLERPVSNPFYPQAVPVALSGEIHKGPASILTVVSGSKIEKYNVEILKVLPNSQSDGKGLVIKITDKKLLQRTGGIVQGMSGSPIIQDGRLVGAVTHVFVNDPTRGYGVLAQWMLQEAEILPRHWENAS